MRVLYFIFPILLVPVFSKIHRCSQCIEEGAKAIERYWHGAAYVRLLYNEEWPSCEHKINVTSQVGCFQVKMSKGAVPKGMYYVMQGPMSSLLTVNGYDLRQRHLDGRQTIVFSDGTEFEFVYCQEEKCFMDLPPRTIPKPLPEPEPLLRGQRTPTTIAPITMTPSTSLASDFGLAALLNPWVLLYMFAISSFCGLLAFFAGFVLAYYCEMSWERRMYTRVNSPNHYEIPPAMSISQVTQVTTVREDMTESTFSQTSPVSSCGSSDAG